MSMPIAVALMRSRTSHRRRRAPGRSRIATRATSRNTTAPSTSSGLADPAAVERLLVGDVGRDRGVTDRTPCHGRLHERRRDDVEADVAACVVGGATGRQPDDCRLGGRIGVRREMCRRGRKRQHRRHVDDRAAVRGAEELPHGRSIGVEQRREVEVEGLLPALVGELSSGPSPNRRPLPPATWKTPSTRPNRSSAASNTRVASAGSVASPRTQGVSGPRLSAALAAYASSRPATVTCAPSRRQARAADRPMPDVPPTTTTDRPSRRPVCMRDSVEQASTLVKAFYTTRHAARPAHDRHRQLPVPRRGSSSRPDTSTRSAPTIVAEMLDDAVAVAVHDQVDAGLDVDHRRRADAARLQPVLLRLPRRHRARGRSRRAASARPAHDQRGKHAVIGELAAPRGLGAVEEFERLRRARAAGPDAEGQRARARTR